MLKKWVVFFVLLFLVKVSLGQSIEGFLIDTASQNPLSFATIKLISSTDSTYQIADELGRFKFSGLKKGTYQLGLNYLGYGSKNIEVIFSSSSDVKLGYVGLEPNLSLLNEVTVYGVKSAAFGNIEKQVFDAGLYEIAKGGTGADILKNLPSVMVNAEGEISVRGSKGFLVLVNGKPSQIDPVTLLAQIPANSIEKIELLTTPSAKL
jgi:ferric enterobactin receptor